MFQIENIHKIVIRFRLYILILMEQAPNKQKAKSRKHLENFNKSTWTQINIGNKQC